MNKSRKTGLFSALFFCFLFVACGNLGPTGGHRAQFLVTLSSLSPSSVTAGGPPFTLTVTGSNFQSAPQTLVWNGGEQLKATNVSASQATFTIDASMIASPGNGSIQFIDGINNNQLSNALTLSVSPRGQTVCALFGTYNFLFTDASGNAIVGAFGVDANGNLNGEEDASGFISDIAYQMTGKCNNGAIPYEGTLTMTVPWPSGSVQSTYTFVLQQGGGQTPRGRLFGVPNLPPITLPGSGIFVGTATDTVLANGDYIFGMLGEDPYGDSGVGAQIAAAGRFTYSNGTLSAGVGDINDGGAVTLNMDVSGNKTTSSLDVWPRMLLGLSLGGLSTPVAIYVNSSGSAFAAGSIATPFPHSSGEGMANAAGFISPQVDPGSYSNASLNAPFVFSLWGAPPPLCCWTTNPSPTDTTVGLASGFDSNTGSFNLLFDNVSGGMANLNQTITGATYDAASNGRTTVSYSFGGQTQNYVYYLDNANDGYILGLANTAEFGFFQPQASGPFTITSIDGTFAAGTFLPETPGSPNLVTEFTLNNGGITASTPMGALSGTYSVAASGRGTATVNLPAIGSNSVVLYVIDPQSVLLMGSGSTANNAITFMHF